MAKLALVMALCLLPALAMAIRTVKNPLKVSGKVYCDTCRAGFETSATTYIAGAKVKIECKDRKTMELVYSKEATTDSTGCYTMLIPEDHEDQVCDAVLVHSPLSNCAKVSPGRDRARVILNCDNGIASNSRFVNSMGFERDEPLAGCANVLKQYQETDNQY